MPKECNNESLSVRLEILLAVAGTIQVGLQALLKSQWRDHFMSFANSLQKLKWSKLLRKDLEDSANEIIDFCNQNKV